MQSARGNPRISNNRNRGGQAQVKIGKFLHFSLYKENKDTMEAVNLLAGALGMKPNFFSTAGTKDRRAVTVQRVSIRGRDPKRVLTANAKLRGLAIGDFKFSDKDLFLGSHNGNEFTIVLKDCAFQGVEGASLEHQIVVAQSTLEKALADIAKHGFINYFGTQRFGTFEIGTHILGMKILQGDLKGVVQDLLSFDPSLASIDPQTIQGDNHRLNDVYRAKALAKYKDSNDPEAAAKLLPRRCNTEFAILRHLCKQSLDYHGAVMSITRNMRNMYLHAYQSLVWNFVASKRWELFGSLVVKGDLVYEAANAAVKVEAGNQESDDEENIHLTGLKSADESAKPCARALTADEAASGLYSINDVILPIPGTDVIYPENELSEFYKEFMGREENGALDPHKMHRSQKAFSLTGDYRKIMGSFIGTPSGEVRTYTHDNDQLVPTDLDKIKARANKTRAEAATAAHGEATAPWDSFARTAQSDESKQAGEDLATNQRRKADNIGDDEVESRVHETWVQTTRDGSNKRVKVSTTTTGNGFENQEDQKAQVNEVDEPANGSHQAGGISGLDVVTIKSLPEVSTTTNLVTEGSWSTRFKKVLTKLYDATLGNIFKMPNTDNYLHKTALRQNYEQAPKPLNSETTDQITDKQDNQTADLPAPLTDTSMIDAPSTTLSQVQAKTIDTQGLDDQEGAIVSNEQQKIAVILRFSLGSSAYATMVLRELQG